jgi:DNA polymerase-3 subunit delta
MAREAAPSAPVCLIHGDDDYAVKQRARQLYQQWSEELGGLDHEIIDAQVANSGEALRALGRLREALQTLPFFGTGKVVWLQNCNFLGMDRTSQAQAVTEAVGELAQELKQFDWRNVRLLISAGDPDKRRTFYKTLEKIATIESFVAWSLNDKDWAGQAEVAARKELRARKKEIDEEALSELVQAVGPHRQQLASEIEKLCLYIGERPSIASADVRAIVSRNKLARAFAVGEALGDRNLPRVLRALDEELWAMKFDKDKSEIGLLYGIISKVRAMLLIKEAVREGWLRPEKDYLRFKNQFESLPASKLPTDKKFNPRALHPFVAHKALLQCANYSTGELVRAMGLLLECNQRLVSRALDETLVLQQTLTAIVRGHAEHFPSASQAPARTRVVA